MLRKLGQSTSASLHRLTFATTHKNCSEARSRRNAIDKLDPAEQRATGKSPPSHADAAHVPFSMASLLRSRWSVAHASIEVGQMGLYRVVPWLLQHAASAMTAPALRGALLGTHAGMIIGLPCLLGFAGQYVTFQWTCQRYDAEQERLFRAVQTRPDLWPEKALRDFATNELTSSALSLARQSVSTTQLGITTGLRIVFSVAQLLTVAWTPASIAAFVGIGATSYVFGRYSQTNLGETVEFRKSQNEMQETARGFWDNMVLNNALNRSAWLQHYEKTKEKFFREGWRNQRGTFLTTLAEELSYLAPMALKQTSSFEESSFPNSPSIFPSSAVDGLIGRFNAAVGLYQVENLRKSLAVVRERHEQTHAQYRKFDSEIMLRDRIHFDRITLQSASSTSPRSVDEALQAFQAPGLWRMRGGNGAGKTSFLLLCKAAFGEDCFVLPAKHELDFGKNTGSSGQMVMSIFARLDALGSKRPRILLLDEWNANLDKNNESKVRSMLDDWRRQHVIVEVIHR